ncbi:MAG: aminotransferase class V-fold PLP-dependent enzyme [Solirubrobacterales bacterium]|nr:aminotransferase class V-fold PLP-dependent enzyme [Solirubrobacterales bacterium]MCO5316791.1 aminotransferase class V-fold PLP-dependent enzyme [Solirubrobacterales bacterium]
MDDQPSRGFASDNCSGAHPAMLDALARVNHGHCAPYGRDSETVRFGELVRAEFGENAVGCPMLNGTGANVAALRAISRPHQAVICAATAHMTVDETAAPEAIAGVKLLDVDTPDGKLTPELAATRLADPADLPHAAWPAVVSITQATEVGTAYSADEVTALAEFAHEHGMLLHVDGARLANAAAHQQVSLSSLSLGAGADVLTLGANKNGAAFGEAVIFAGPELAVGFEVLRKGSLQLASKMRFVSAQLNAQLEGELWREIAGHSNAIARTLGDAVSWTDGVEVAQKVEANIVFLSLPLEAGRRLVESLAPHRPLLFEAGEAAVIRLVASWDSRTEDVDLFVHKLTRALAP